jgi:polar amino acid transport system substrate-binding protein
MRLASLLACLLTVTACSLPADPEGSTERIRTTRIVRAGISINPPWVTGAGPQPQGIEPELIRAFARTLGAEVSWTVNGETPLLEALERGELDIVAAGASTRSPWSARLGASQVFAAVDDGSMAGERHILFTRPGENRLLLELDRFLVARRPAVEARLRQGGGG